MCVQGVTTLLSLTLYSGGMVVKLCLQFLQCNAMHVRPLHGQQKSLVPGFSQLFQGSLLLHCNAVHVRPLHGLQESLVPVPTQLFQGSLLLGSIANSVLGEEAMRNSNVLIHPILIGGWCGLVATALNSLPVGSLDGGKMFQVHLLLLYVGSVRRPHIGS